MSDLKFKKILNHPDRDEIISKLINGESIKSVEKWLAKKHPRSPRLKVSGVSLQAFRKNYLNLEGEVLDDIKQVKLSQDKESKVLETRAILAGTSPYHDAITKIATQELDVRSRILELDQLLSSRIQYWFDNVSAGNASSRDDHILLEHINSLRALMQDWKKLVEGMADKRIDHNINITVIQDQVSVLRNVIFEVLKEMAPNLIPLFVDRMNTKIAQLEHGNEQYKQYALEVIDVEPDPID